jgi:hypothetical protein
MEWKWLKAARERDWSISFSWAFNGPTADRDICRACGRERQFHRREDDHRFVEKEDRKEKP